MHAAMQAHGAIQWRAGASGTGAGAGGYDGNDGYGYSAPKIRTHIDTTPAGKVGGWCF